MAAARYGKFHGPTLKGRIRPESNAGMLARRRHRVTPKKNPPPSRGFLNSMASYCFRRRQASAAVAMPTSASVPGSGTCPGASAKRHSSNPSFAYRYSE